MNTTFYVGPNVCGLKFDNSTDRDKFWSDLSNPHRGAAEKIKNRTIRFYPARMAEPGFQWPLSLNGSKPVEVKQSQPAPQQRDTVTSNPFANVATNPTKPLPGLVPPPPPEMLAVNQPPPPATPEALPEPAQGERMVTMSEESLAGAKNDDPEPQVDKRSRQWRAWKARQKTA